MIRVESFQRAPMGWFPFVEMIRVASFHFQMLEGPVR
jgi:hypothetical protein